MTQPHGGTHEVILVTGAESASNLVARMSIWGVAGLKPRILAASPLAVPGHQVVQLTEAALRSRAGEGIPIVADSPRAGLLATLATLSSPLLIHLRGAAGWDPRSMNCYRSTPEVELHRAHDEKRNQAFREAARPLFARRFAHVVFESEHHRAMVEHNVGRAAKSSSVLPAFPGMRFLGPVASRPSDASILLMDGTHDAAYSADIALRSLEVCIAEPWFRGATVTLVGTGHRFLRDAATLNRMPGVTLEESEPGTAERVELLDRHRVALWPSRAGECTHRLEQALARGASVVGSRVGSIADLDGLVTASNTPYKFAAGIRQVLRAGTAADPERNSHRQSLHREVELVRRLLS